MRLIEDDDVTRRAMERLDRVACCNWTNGTTWCPPTRCYWRVTDPTVHVSLGLPPSRPSRRSVLVKWSWYLDLVEGEFEVFANDMDHGDPSVILSAADVLECLNMCESVAVGLVGIVEGKGKRAATLRAMELLDKVSVDTSRQTRGGITYWLVDDRTAQAALAGVPTGHRWVDGVLVVSLMAEWDGFVLCVPGQPGNTQLSAHEVVDRLLMCE